MEDWRKWIVDIIRQLLGDSAKGVGDSILLTKLGQVPVRVALVSLLVAVLLRIKSNVHPDIKRLFLLNHILSALGIYYTLDLFEYLFTLYSFDHPYSLPLFARLVNGNEVVPSTLAIFQVATLIAFLLAFLNPARPVWKLLAFFGFAASEAFVYGFGYTENTFTSFRIAQWFLFLSSAYHSSKAILYGQIAILLCYAFPGLEKLLSFAFGLLNGHELNFYARYFHLDEEFFRHLFIAGMIFQVVILAAMNNRHLKRVAFPFLVAFHLGTAFLGVGGITTPWIPALLLLLV